jgi:hypothetical protein
MAMQKVALARPAAIKKRWFKLGIKGDMNVRRNPGKNKIEKD